MLDQLVKQVPSSLVVFLLVVITAVISITVLMSLSRGKSLRSLRVKDWLRLDLDFPIRGSDPATKTTALTKLLHVRLICLRHRDENVHPFYFRQIPRLESEPIPVYDEAVYTIVHTFKEERQRFKWRFRSSGVVDPRTIDPWIDKLVFSDQPASREKHLVEQTIKSPEPRSTFIVESRMYNGFQPGNEDAGTQAEYDTEYVRLVVDLTSIPNIENALRSKPTAVFRVGETESPIDVKEVTSTIFTVARRNMKQGQVIRMDFSIDWDAL